MVEIPVDTGHMEEPNSLSSSEAPIEPDPQIDGKEFFNISEEDEGKNEEKYRRMLMKTGFGMAKRIFEEAYNGVSDDTAAIECLENFAVPAFRYYHNLRGEEPEVDLDYWKDLAINEINNLREKPIFGPRFEPLFNVKAEKDNYPEMYKEIQEEFEKDQFDQLVGVFSSGIPPLYTASTYLEGDEILLRYSHHSRDDNSVKITDTMEERQDFYGANVLIADDCHETGETFQEVTKYLIQHGAKNVKAVEANANIYDLA